MLKYTYVVHSCDQERDRCKLLEISQKIDWKEIEDSTSKLLSRLIGFDTTNPPGKTADAAAFICESFQVVGIDSIILPTEGDKRNVVAQLDGSGQSEPMLLISSLDIPESDNTGTGSFNPFSGYDDGSHIWGRGSIAAKSLLAVQTSCMILINSLNLPLKQHIRFAAIADGFSSDWEGLKYLTENHLTLIEAERCLCWGYPPSTEIDGKIAFFLHSGERDALELIIKVDGTGTPLGNKGASASIIDAVKVISEEFESDFGVDPLVKEIFEDLQSISGDDDTSSFLSDLIQGKPSIAERTDDEKNLPDTLVDYIQFLHSSSVRVKHLEIGSSTGMVARFAEAKLVIQPCPGTSLTSVGERVVNALERLGEGGPYIARAEHLQGSFSEFDEELHRILLAACQAVHSDTELIRGICPYPQGLNYLRQLDMRVYGFHPLVNPEGIDDTSKRSFGPDERVNKASLGQAVRILFEALVRLAS